MRIRDCLDTLPSPVFGSRLREPYVDVLVYAKTIEGSLKYFEVVEEVDLEVCLPLHFVQWHFLWECCIQKLAIYVSGAKLLDFGEMSDQKVVDPVNDLVAGGEIGAVTHIRCYFINIKLLTIL